MSKVIVDSEIRITNPYQEGVHRGVDLGWRIDEEQNKVYSNCKGTVIATLDNIPNGSEQGGGWGNYVLIKHPNGMCSRYAHLQNGVRVSVGQEVDENTLLGIIGDSGRAYGRHLHFEVANNENASSRIDPTPYLTKAIYEEPTPTKSIDELAREVINGNWGNGQERYDRLTQAGYNYDEVQARVNEILAGDSPEEPIKEGDWVVPIEKVDYYGTPVAQYDDKYKVTELHGNRAVLSAERDGQLVTWCAMDVTNLKKI